MRNSKGLFLTYKETLEYLANLLRNEDINNFTIAKVLKYATEQGWGDIYYLWKYEKPFIFRELDKIIAK